jgi:hypothetical protein
MAIWAVRLPSESAHAVASIRTVSSVEVCPQTDQIWCRGDTSDEAMELRLRQLPGAWRYDVTADGQLIPVGELAPCEKMPPGPWVRIGDWLRLELPDAETSRGEFSRRSLPRVSLTLVRDATPRQPTILRTSIQAFERYGSNAPAVRISQWTFVMRADGECLVRGLPLPPVPGEQIVEFVDLLVPAGLIWSPTVDVAVIRELFQLQSGDLALLRDDGGWELIQECQWVRATRAAIRMSARGATQIGN